MIDQLTEIDRKDLPKLKSHYTPDESKYLISYTTIDTYIQWFEKDPNVKHIKFYCLNGDFSRGTFVVTDQYSCIAYADTLSESTEELLRLLLLIDYSNGFFFTSLNDRAASTLREATKQKSIEVYDDQTNLLYHLPKEKALEFNVQPPNGITLKSLTKLSHFQKAYTAWPGNKKTSVKTFERFGQFNPCVGAFLEDDTLVSWVLRFSSGLLLALQTDMDYLGHGYASLVVKAISKQVAELGHDITVGVFDVNTPSRALFEKLGFNVIGNVHWICTKITWDDVHD